MNVFTPEMVAQRWVFSRLVASAPLLAALGSTASNPRIIPNIATAEVTKRHITHWFYGPAGGILARPVGQPVVQVGMIWRVTGWEPSFDQQTLDPVMKAVMTALSGADGRGIVVRYVDDDGAFTMESHFAGPEIAAVAPASEGVWSPVHHLYAITVRPVS